MNTKALILAGAIALAVSPAMAANLVNEDTVAYEVEIDDGKDVRVVIIAPGENIANICDACTLTIGDSSHELDGTKVAVIRNGALNSK